MPKETASRGPRFPNDAPGLVAPPPYRVYSVDLEKVPDRLEINDLVHGSPLEDRLWAAFKLEGIEAERQWS